MDSDKKNTTRSGFTLVELSLVLVIIGLVVGGVFVGRELIKAAEINSVVAQFREYEAAYKNFEIRYNALPGDFSSATDYWPTTANGNNDRMITWSGSESLRAWQQLALAGIITGTYAGTGATAVGGTNAPSSKISRGVFVLYYADPTFLWNTGNLVAGNFIELIMNNTALTTSPRGILRPIDAAAIDTKMDDGAFSSGRVIGGIGSTNGSYSPYFSAACTVNNSGSYAYFLSYGQQETPAAGCTISYRME